MIIETLTNTGILYRVHRDKAYLQYKMDKRRAFVLTLAIFSVVAMGVVAWILQS